MTKKSQKKKVQEKKRVPLKKKVEKKIPLGFGFTKWNWVIFGLGLLSILLGYIFLIKGDITIAPILLVAGYCVIIPLAIIWKWDIGKIFSKSEESARETPDS